MSSSNSQSKQSSNTTTTSQAYNQQVGASEGSIAFGGSGNTSQLSITNTNNDAAVVKAASDAMLGASTEAIRGNSIVTRDALGTVGTLSNSAINAMGIVNRDSLGFAESVLGKALQSNGNTTSAAIDLASATTRGANEMTDAMRMTLQKAAESPTERSATELFTLAGAAVAVVAAIAYVGSKR